MSEHNENINKIQFRLAVTYRQLSAVINQIIQAKWVYQLNGKRRRRTTERKKKKKKKNNEK